MEAIKLLVDNAKKIDINRSLEEVLEYESIQDLIIELNTQNQLFDNGIDIKGEIVGLYSQTTESVFGGAQSGKFAGEHYNFDDTGSFFKSFSVKSYYKHFEIEADTRKMQTNKNIKGKELIGLVDSSLQKLIDAITPILITNLEEDLTRW